MPQQEFDARLAAHCLDKIAQMEGIMPFLGGWGRYIYIYCCSFLVAGSSTGVSLTGRS